MHYKSLFTIFFQFAKQHKILWTIWFISCFFSHLFLLFPSYLVEMIIKDLTYNTESHYYLMIKYFLIVFSGTFLHCFLWRIQQWLRQSLTPGFQKYISNVIINAMFKKNIFFFQRKSMSSSITQINDINSTFENFLYNELPIVINTVLVVLILSINIFYFHYSLVLFFLIYIMLVILSKAYTMRKMEILIENDVNANSAIHTILSTIFSNILSIKLCNKNKSEIENINDIFNNRKKTHNAIESLENRVEFVVGIFYSLFLSIFISTTLFLKLKNIITPENVIFLVTSILIVTGWLWLWGETIVKVYSKITKMKKTYDDIIQPNITEQKNSGSINFINGDIRFEHVFFSYTNDSSEKKETLHNLSFTILCNQKIGLVGPSGHGKSTTINLLLKLYTVDSGTITIGNNNIQDIITESLYENIAYVTQMPVLFNRSIKENMCYGCDINDETLYEISKIVDLHDFILTLPDGYNTMIGENGSTLSGGQRQRIAIARALLKDSSIMIFDESTSQIDTITENKIIEYIYSLPNKTVIFIAHRLNTLIKADTIFVFENGTIIQSGKHETLLTEDNGLYKKLWNNNGKSEQFNTAMIKWLKKID